MIQNRPTPDQILQRQKVRLRNIAFLREVLQGTDPDVACAAHGISKSKKTKVIMDLITILFYRCRDRTGLLKSAPSRVVYVFLQREFWLQKLNENEDLLKELNPPTGVPL